MKGPVKIFIVLLIIFQLAVYLFINRDFFSRKFDPAYYADLYSKSQYVLGPKSVGGIGDDGLYAFAGYFYLFQGGDVTDVNFEHPPIGKYLIGLSIFLFQNENVINIFYYLILLAATYQIGKIILKNSFFSIAAVGILSSNLLILDHLKRSLLDIPFTLFFTIAVYFFLSGLQNAKYYFLSMLFWGLAFSTRFFPAIVIVYLYLLLIVYRYNRRSMHLFLIASPFIPIIYLISHMSFFAYHPSFWEFLRHKKWMLSWFSGTVNIIGNIWLNIFTGRYIDSYKKLAVNEHWDILVPISVFFSLIPIKKVFLNKKNIGLTTLYGLIVIYFLYLTLLTSGLEKFLMPIYPVVCIVAISNAVSLYSIISAWRRPMSKPLKES